MSKTNEQQPCVTPEEYQFDTFIGTVSAIRDDDDAMVDRPSQLGYGNSGDLEVNLPEEEDVIHGVIFDDGEEDGGLKLSRRTNRVLSSYQDYIRNIEAETIKSGLGPGNASKSCPGGAGHRVKRGSEDQLELLNSDCYSFRDFSQLNEEYATSNLHDWTSLNVTGGRGSRNHRYHFYRSNKFRVIASSVLIGLIVLVLGLNASNENELDVYANAKMGLRQSDKSASEKLGEVAEQYPEGHEHKQNEIDDEFAFAEPISTKMLERYRPSFIDRTQWEGNTYDDARDFCASRDGLILCPFEVACPLGIKSVRSGTIQLDAEQMFVPIWSESMRGEWVRIGHENSCGKTHGELPESEGQAVMAGNLFCCYGDEGLSLTTEGGEDYAEATTTYDSSPLADEAIIDDPNQDTNALEEDAGHNAPIVFNRGNGWNGETYLEAVQFCSSQPGYHICSHRDICPHGPESAPAGGYKAATDAFAHAWVPISDSSNEWVMVSSTDSSCKRYSQLFDELPSWGEVGGNEAGTENIFCCEGSAKESLEEDFVYGISAKKFHPTWYSRSEGWKGRTWQEANQFCTGKSLELCKYDAYCPMSDLDTPTGGVKDRGSYAPVGGNDAMWISISDAKPCTQYNVIHGKPPQEILPEEASRNVACCMTTSVSV